MSRSETSFDANTVFTARAPKPTPPVEFQNAAEYVAVSSTTSGTSTKNALRRRKNNIVAKTVNPAASATTAARRSESTNTHTLGMTASNNRNFAHRVHASQHPHAEGNEEQPAVQQRRGMFGEGLEPLTLRRGERVVEVEREEVLHREREHHRPGEPHVVLQPG